MILGKVCISHGHRQRCMPQDVLERDDVPAVHDEVTCEGVPRYMPDLHPPVEFDGRRNQYISKEL